MTLKRNGVPRGIRTDRVADLARARRANSFVFGLSGTRSAAKRRYGALWWWSCGGRGGPVVDENYRLRCRALFHEAARLRRDPDGFMHGQLPRIGLRDEWPVRSRLHVPNYYQLCPSRRRHGRSRPQNDVSSELIGVKQADALPNALGAF